MSSRQLIVPAAATRWVNDTALLVRVVFPTVPTLSRPAMITGSAGNAVNTGGTGAAVVVVLLILWVIVVGVHQLAAASRDDQRAHEAVLAQP